MPGIMNAPYPIELIDQGEKIIIKLEEYDSIREVHMVSTHDDSAEKHSALGYSTGYWVGDVLNVSTTKMNYGLVPGAEPQCLGAQVNETFMLRSDRNYLDYTKVVIGPEMRTAPSIYKKW